MKSKGTRTERELFHLFWNNGWSAVRSAGSGSTPLPSPDIIAGNTERYLAIECKAVNASKVYLKNKEIKELKDFSKKFGSEAWIGVRFNKLGWFFLTLDDLGNSKGGNFVVSQKLAQDKGLNFKQLIGNLEIEDLL